MFHFLTRATITAAGLWSLAGMASCKSTLLQAIALTLLGPLGGQRLVRSEGWVRDGIPHGSIAAEIVKGPNDSQVGQPRGGPTRSRLPSSALRKSRLTASPMISRKSCNWLNRKIASALQWSRRWETAGLVFVRLWSLSATVGRRFPGPQSSRARGSFRNPLFGIGRSDPVRRLAHELVQPIEG